MSADDITWPPHKGGLHISHNDHHGYYQKVEEAIGTEGGYGPHPTYDRSDFPDEAEVAKAIAMDSVWTIQWYPNSPNGFNRVHAATLGRALEAAVSQ